MDPPPPAVDLLSSLPEPLLDGILARLDLRDAVRTSAISRAWRRRWETVPRLALSFPAGTAPSAIDRVLLRYAGSSVSRFVSHVDGDDPGPHVEDWLIALSRRRVESVAIFKESRGHCTVHSSSIFYCNRLVSLSLESCCILPLFPRPGGGGFAGLPVLKELYLRFVDFAFAEEGEGQLPAMIRASPMLRVLFLDEVFGDGADCVIEAPNLRSLTLISRSDDWRFRQLPRLQYASIDVANCMEGGSSFLELLASVSQVQKLIIELPTRGLKMDVIPFTFYNLKSLELPIHFASVHHILLLFCLLKSSPSLEDLKIEVRWSSTMVVNPAFLNAQWTDGMCANLQVVQMTSYKGWLPLSFIELILSKASLLRTLSVDASPVSLNCKRASPQAQVLFKVQLEKISFDRMKFAEKRLN